MPLECTVIEKSCAPLPSLTHGSFSNADILGFNLLFCASFQYPKIWPPPAKNFKQLQVFSVSPSYSWQCGRASEAAHRPQDTQTLLPSILLFLQPFCNTNLININIFPSWRDYIDRSGKHYQTLGVTADMDDPRQPVEMFWLNQAPITISWQDSMWQDGKPNIKWNQ